MIVSELNFQHQIIVPVTETSPKMASTLCQRFLTIFLGQKTQNFVWFEPYDFVQISPACAWSKYASNNVSRDFRLPMSASAIVT